MQLWLFAALRDIAYISAKLQFSCLQPLIFSLAIRSCSQSSFVCHYRHPYKRVLTLSNGSKLPCKCEVMGQEARSQGLATFTTTPNAGVIPAKGTLDVEVTLQASRLGRIQLPLQIKVCCFSCLTWACNQGCLWFLSQQSNRSAAPASGCLVSL